MSACELTWIVVHYFVQVLGGIHPVLPLHMGLGQPLRHNRRDSSENPILQTELCPEPAASRGCERGEGKQTARGEKYTMREARSPGLASKLFS